MSTKNLTCISVDRYIFKVTIQDKERQFPCTAFVLNMTINEISSAQVTLSGGTEINGTAEYTAEDVLKHVLSKRTAAYTDIVPCSLYEGTNRVFQGYIVTGSLIYRTEVSTLKAVRLSCLGPACKLLAAPLAAYTYVEGSRLLGYIAGEQKAREGLLTGNLSLLSSITSLDKEIASELAQQADADIVKRISFIISKMIGEYGKSLSSNPDTITARYQISSALFSQYTVSSNDQIMLPESNNKFNQFICAGLLAQLRQTSIFNAILNVIRSTDLMLNMVPRWDKDDFKMEITPSTAWSAVSKDRITLQNKHIMSINSELHPIEGINTPDVFMVDYDDVVNFYGASADSPYTAGGCCAAFSIIPELQARIQDSAVSISDSIKKTPYRLKVFRAPSWIIPVEAKNAYDKKVSGVADVKTSDTKSGSAAAPAASSSPDTMKIAKSAQEIAKALFTYIYGSSDKVVLKLVPSIRFGLDASIGCLENSIGKTIDVELDKPIDNTFSLRGVLQTIRYTYYAAENSGIEYEVVLQNVRPLDKDEKSIDCPLYTKIKA